MLDRKMMIAAQGNIYIVFYEFLMWASVRLHTLICFDKNPTRKKKSEERKRVDLYENNSRVEECTFHWKYSVMNGKIGEREEKSDSVALATHTIAHELTKSLELKYIKQ